MWSTSPVTKMDNEWVQVLKLLASVWLALLIPIALPFVLRWIFNRRAASKASAAASSSATAFVTLQEYMLQRGLSERDGKFQVAVDFVGSRFGKTLSNEQRLALYALFKQAQQGECKQPKPSAVDMVRSAKWHAWRALGSMTSEDAKEKYVSVVQQFFGDRFAISGKHPGAKGGAAGGPPSSGGDDGMIKMGAVSTMLVDKSGEEWQVQEDSFHFASTGELGKVQAEIAKGKLDVNAQDNDGRTMLHWAVDRSQLEVVKFLLEQQADVNVQDTDGMTCLHYAVNCEETALVKLLVEHGARVDIEDNDGDTPATCASDAIRQMLEHGRRK